MAFRIEFPELIKVQHQGPNMDLITMGGAVPAIIGGAAAIGGSLLGSKKSSKGQKQAAQEARAGTEYSANIQKEMLEKVLAQQQPFANLGYGALPQLRWWTGVQNSALGETNPIFQFQQRYMNALGGGPSTQTFGQQLQERLGSLPFISTNIEGSPLYQWQRQQGEEAINRAAAARGLYDSRAALSQLSDFNQSLAANESDKMFNRYYFGRQQAASEVLEEMKRRAINRETATAEAQSQYGRLLDLANIGRGAVTAGSAATQASGATLSSLYQSQGNTLANIASNIGNIKGSFYSGLGGLGAGLASYYGSRGGFGGSGGSGGSSSGYGGEGATSSYGLPFLFSQ